MKIKNKIRALLSEYTWDLAYGTYDPSEVPGNNIWQDIHYVTNPYKTKWFADPFILEDKQDSLILLVEEFDSEINRGRIAKIIIDKKKDIITDCKIILDKETHLSFPVIYRQGGIILVHPENSASGKSCMYEYDIHNEKLINPTIVADLPLVDSIIRKDGCVYKMYATRTPDTCGSNLDVYESEEFMGPYIKKDVNTYKGKEARMAGEFLSTKSGLIRPAQDCNHNYGEAVLFYSSSEIVSEIRPDSLKYEGVHTFNTMGSTFIIDLKKYKFPLVHKIYRKLKNLIAIEYD